MKLLVLLGPNGAGKTTTFYMVVRAFAKIKVKLLLMAKMLVCSQCITARNVALGYLPQEASIFAV